MNKLAIRRSPNEQRPHVKKAPSDGCSVWLRDQGKLDEVLAFQTKHRSSQDLLAEFKSQQRARKEKSENEKILAIGTPGQAVAPESMDLSTQQRPRSRKQPSRKDCASSCQSAESRWSGDHEKLDEVLTFHGKQRSSQELLAEFKAQTREAQAARQPVGEPQEVRRQTNGHRVPSRNSHVVDSPTPPRSQFAAGQWDRDTAQLDVVLSFQENQRPSLELLMEFKRDSRPSSVQSPPALRGSSVASPLSSPESGGGRLESPPISGLDKLELSKEPSPSERQQNSLSAWNRDKDKLDEVLAFHTKQRCSDDLVKEFQAQQRARKEAAKRKGQRLGH